jgi:hypothetical protein
MRRSLLAIPCLSFCALAMTACATTTQTSSFKGAEHNVAQTIANLQSHVTSSEQKKVCEDDLAAAIVQKLGGAHGCETAIKEQLAQIDSTELEVESVKVSGTTATAVVKSIYAGKKKEHSVSLIEEGGKWKVSSLQ